MDAKITFARVADSSGREVSPSNLKIGDVVTTIDAPPAELAVTHADESMVLARHDNDTYILWLSDDILQESIMNAPAEEAEAAEVDSEGVAAVASLPSVDSFPLLRKIKNIWNFNPRELDFSIPLRKPPQLAGVHQLQTGDILLKQSTIDNKHDALSVPIIIAQYQFNDLHPYIGASLLTHAAIYVGGGQVLEAVGPGVVPSSLKSFNQNANAHYAHYNWYVIRSKHPGIAQAAARAALELATKNKGQKIKIKYAYKKLAGNTLLRAIKGESIANYLTADTTNAFHKDFMKGKEVTLFCSELVVYCYHRAADGVKRKRFFRGIRQDQISPEQLYVLARQDKENFVYVGELHKGVR